MRVSNGRDSGIVLVDHSMQPDRIVHRALPLYDVPLEIKRENIPGRYGRERRAKSVRYHSIGPNKDAQVSRNAPAQPVPEQDPSPTAQIKLEIFVHTRSPDQNIGRMLTPRGPLFKSLDHCPLESKGPRAGELSTR